MYSTSPHIMRGWLRAGKAGCVAVMGGSEELEIRSFLVRSGFRRRLSLGGKGGMVIINI